MNIIVLFNNTAFDTKITEVKDKTPDVGRLVKPLLVIQK